MHAVLASQEINQLCADDDGLLINIKIGNEFKLLHTESHARYYVLFYALLDRFFVIFGSLFPA